MYLTLKHKFEQYLVTRKFRLQLLFKVPLPHPLYFPGSLQSLRPNSYFQQYGYGAFTVSGFSLTLVYDELIRRLQSVQNTAARLVTGTRRSDHISPVLRQLHWLPVRQRVVFKVATLVYQSLCGHAPSYLVDDCQLATDVRARKLRSADTRTLAVNRTRSSFGDRTFAAAATTVWNSLPPDMRKPELSYGQFRRSLKTFLFGQ